jgi:FAD/FMN-containing dehydrogenase
VSGVLDRRGFLTGAAAVAAVGAAAGLAAACTGDAARSATTPTPGGAGHGPAGTTGSPGAGAGPADWTALARDLDEDLVRPGDADYDSARLLFNTRFDATRPAAVAYCTAPDDVRRCIEFARRFAVPLATRSGGHSYIGASTGPGLVLDVSRMNAIRVDAATGTATVGAGARLIDLYAALAADRVTVPAGSCPTVGIAGLTLGGGIGVTGRAYGLTSDTLVAAQIVTAAGRVLTCAADREPDLFWACRGGGGNVGVVTSFTFRTRPAPDVTLFYLAWPWSRAARVVAGWQAWAPAAPDPLWSSCKLLVGRGRPGPRVHVAGAYLGSSAELSPLLEGLAGRVGSDPSVRSMRTLGFLPAMLVEAGCAPDGIERCHLPSQATGGGLSRQGYVAKSHFVDRPVPAAGLAAMVRWVVGRGSVPGGGEGGIALDAMGGAFNRLAPAATAFVHRDTLFLAQLTSTWFRGAGAAAVRRQQDWLRGFHAALRPYATGGAYQNYADADLTDWPRAYYGANYPRLVRVKAAYDPDSLFRQPQGIPAR